MSTYVTFDVEIHDMARYQVFMQGVKPALEAAAAPVQKLPLSPVTCSNTASESRWTAKDVGATTWSSSESDVRH